MSKDFFLEMTAKTHVRWMIQRDMPAVLEIERRSYDRPWQEQDFRYALSQRNCIGLVSEVGETITGFVLYELHEKFLRVLNLAVHPEYRLRGTGHCLIKKLKDKLENGRRKRLVATLRESNLPAQLFFRQCGFRATRVLRDNFSDTGEDGYRFVFRVASDQRKSA